VILFAFFLGLRQFEISSSWLFWILAWLLLLFDAAFLIWLSRSMHPR